MCSASLWRIYHIAQKLGNRFLYLHLCSIGISVLLLFHGTEAAQLKVVTTGDSLTNTYQYYYPITDSINYFSDTGNEVKFQTIAVPGITTWQYSGDRPCPPGSDSYHDYARDVAKVQPDYIVFMLGTNDVRWTPEDLYWNYFQSSISEIFDHWKNGPNVIVMSILPQIGASNSEANQRIDEKFNPLLRQQAENYGFTYLDVNSRLQEQADWKSYYYGDGIHLNASPGYYWLSRTVCDAVKEKITSTPEPATWLLLLLAGISALSCRLRRTRALGNACGDERCKGKT